MAPFAELLDLQPLPLAVLKNKQLEALYSFSHFNPIQVFGLVLVWLFRD